MKLEAIKRSIVSDKTLWGEPAAIPDLISRFQCTPTNATKHHKTLTDGGFIVPSPKGPVFGTFSVLAIETSRLTLSSLESVAAARAIHFPGNAAKFNFHAMSEALSEAIERGDPIAGARCANGLLACLFDIAELEEMGKVHHKKATEANVYAWGNQLEHHSLRALHHAFNELLAALEANDVTAAIHAAHIREIGIITDRNKEKSQAA